MSKEDPSEMGSDTTWHRASDWHEVLCFGTDEDVRGDPDADVCVIVGIQNSFSPNVDVLAGGRTQSVFMPWNRRFRHFAEFVTECNSVFRVQVWNLGTRVAPRGLLVNRAAFADAMQTKGTFDGEVYAAAVLAEHFASAYVKGSFYSFPPSASSADDSGLSTSQRCSLDWMRHTETLVRSRRSSVRFAQDIPIAGSWSFDHHMGAFSRTAGSVSSLHMRGGVVVDGCGMGKTAVAIRLISETARVSPADVPRWNDAELIQTNATLVVVPPHLAPQWVSEVRRTAAHLRVVMLIGVKDLRGSTLQDVMDADIVVTSVMCLRSRLYCDLVESRMHSMLFRPDVATLKDRRAFRSRACAGIFARRVRQVGDYTGAVVFEAFAWKRVIVDEFAQSFAAAIRVLRNISANFWWGLAADPRDRDIGGYAQLMLADDCGNPPAHHPALSRLMMHHVVKGTRRSAPLDLRRSAHAFESEPLASPVGSESATQESICGVSTPCSGLPLVSVSSLSSMLPSSEFAAETVKKLGEREETCTVCFGAQSDTALLGCAHIFCRRCVIDMYRFKHRRCPVCRVELRESSPFGASLLGNSLTRHAAAVLGVCLRMANDGERGVVVGALPCTLRFMSEVLSANGVSTLLADGNAANSTVARFRESTASVALLATDTALCGVDMSFVKHIVLLDDADHVDDAALNALVLRCSSVHAACSELELHTFYRKSNAA